MRQTARGVGPDRLVEDPLRRGGRVDLDLIPAHADIPHIDVHYLSDPDPTMPLALLGLGEIGITGAPAAIANAVRHATGKRVPDLSITLDKVL